MSSDDLDPRLAEVLARLPPVPADPPGTWDDVLRRAHALAGPETTRPRGSVASAAPATRPVANGARPVPAGQPSAARPASFRAPTLAEGARRWRGVWSTIGAAVAAAAVLLLAALAVLTSGAGERQRADGPAGPAPGPTLSNAGTPVPLPTAVEERSWLARRAGGRGLTASRPGGRRRVLSRGSRGGRAVLGVRARRGAGERPRRRRLVPRAAQRQPTARGVEVPAVALPEPRAAGVGDDDAGCPAALAGRLRARRRRRRGGRDRRRRRRARAGERAGEPVRPVRGTEGAADRAGRRRLRRAWSGRSPGPSSGTRTRTARPTRSAPGRGSRTWPPSAARPRRTSGCPQPLPRSIESCSPTPLPATGRRRRT